MHTHHNPKTRIESYADGFTAGYERLDYETWQNADWRIGYLKGSCARASHIAAINRVLKAMRTNLEIKG